MEVVQLSPRVWRFHDTIGSTSYLVVGDERAAMVDCGMGREPVMPLIREITQLPVALYVTHAHADHYGASAEFDEVYIHSAERDILDYMDVMFGKMGAGPINRAALRFFEDGAEFDLGGEKLTVIDLAGHTPGSVVFRADASKMLFMGDAIGSGYIVLMAIDKASTLSVYKRSLEAFLEKANGLDDYIWQGGHYHQAGTPGTPEYNPLRRKVVEDMITLCAGLLDGSIQPQHKDDPISPDALLANYGSAGMILLASNIA